MTLHTTACREPTYSGRNLSFSCNHPPHVKRGLIQNLLIRASTICQKRRDHRNAIRSFRCDFQCNGCPQGFIDSIINSEDCGRSTKEGNPLRSVYMPYAKGALENFKRVGNIYIALGQSSERNTILGAHSWEPGQKGIHNTRNRVSTALPVDVAEATLVKQADH
jgi:hypothetical protein